MATRTRKVPAKLAAARAAHDKFLRKMGIDPDRKPTLKGYVDNPLTSSGSKRVAPHAGPSDLIPGSGEKAKPTPFCDLPIAQVYHKGPLMVVTDMNSLTGSKRRN